MDKPIASFACDWFSIHAQSLIVIPSKRVTRKHLLKGELNPTFFHSPRLYESALNGDEHWMARGNSEITNTPVAAAVAANQV